MGNEAQTFIPEMGPQEGRNPARAGPVPAGLSTTAAT
jgi:hypothetical protein